MQQTLRANDLGKWPSSFDGIKVLSLDCFDTLLWRKVAAPTDVFFSLSKSDEFKAAGLTATLRAKAERTARQVNKMSGHGTEVTIEEIYRAALPSASPAVIASLVEREIECEARHCFIFQPVFDLILRARESGVKVVIVSDTYLSEAQLKKLLTLVMPGIDEVLDSVFCSSSRGLSKSGGIWKVVLPLLRVPASAVLHLGDNERADLLSPMKFGMKSVHLIQQSEQVKDILFGREQAAVQVLPDLRLRDPLPSLHHGLFATNPDGDVLDTLGYVTLGPIMHAFAKFILDEAQACQESKQQGEVKLAFLLRDGFLPSKACESLAGKPIGCELNISRFTSIAATLESKERVVSLLSRMLTPSSLEAMARQLQLPPEMASRILKRAQRSDNPAGEFAALVLQKETLSVIFAQSRLFRRRLVAHVQKVSGVRKGDTLMFVDLGYSGTAQTLLKDVLRKDLGVDLVASYLICEHVAADQTDRKGLIDASRHDGRIVGALTGQYIAGFEMLCAQNAPSTVGYTEDGDPVFSSSSLGRKQHAAVAAIQSGCLRFIEDERNTPSMHKSSASAQELSQSVAIDLARLLYFPSVVDIQAMEQFQFDFNLGTDKKLALFNVEAGLQDMRVHGFAYMNTGLDNLRTNYPTELRHLDLSLSALLFAQNRFGFATRTYQASYRTETIPVLVANQVERANHVLTAVATHDGYYALNVPVSDKFDVAVHFGDRYRWVQLESVQVVLASAPGKGKDLVIGEQAIPDQMAYHDDGLFEVADNGMLFIPASADHKQTGTVCRIVFRPTVTKRTQPQ